jgi:YfiR/HmsC-like
MPAMNDRLHEPATGTRQQCSRRTRPYSFVLGLLLFHVALNAHATATRMEQIEAAFVYNFTKFIEWPPQSFANVNAPIVIGVLGDSPMAAALEEVVHDRKVNGHPIVVRMIHSVADARSAHVLFVSVTEIPMWTQVQAAMETLPIVTIGESPSFGKSGGTINFVPQDDKVRFEINMSAAERSGVKISAQLQKLAAAVRRVP